MLSMRPVEVCLGSIQKIGCGIAAFNILKPIEPPLRGLEP